MWALLHMSVGWATISERVGRPTGGALRVAPYGWCPTGGALPGPHNESPPGGPGHGETQEDHHLSDPAGARGPEARRLPHASNPIRLDQGGREESGLLNPALSESFGHRHALTSSTR